MAMDDVLARLKAANADFEHREDQDLREELQEKREATAAAPEAFTAEAAVFEGAPAVPDEFVAETIVRRTGRPVLAIVRNETQLEFTDPDSDVWRERLQAASAHLVRAAQAVGRIELEGHPDFEWVGTGWLVRPDVIVTNRHVAEEFGRQSGQRFVFQQGTSGRDMSASIDFLEEIGRTESLTFRVQDILHIEEAGGPDIAFLRVTQMAGQALAAPIRLAARSERDEKVAVIGYPARDSRIPDQRLMDRIFGDVYDKKRLAPGQLTRVDSSAVNHDCSTLGGNSGSVVLSLQSGEAVGLHFAGRFLQANFAVPSAVVARRLDQVARGPVRRRPSGSSRPEAAEQLPAAGSSSSATTKVSYVFPLRVTIEVGAPTPDTGAAQPHPAPPRPEDFDEDEVLSEGVPADYRNRKGYQSDFLGDGAEVPLPEVTEGADDVLTFTFDGRTEKILKYEHFSVLMSESRRLCRYSAVNIDGEQSRSSNRGSWRTDPRIPIGAQIKKECYGAPPKFSRGHMTRREDPAWGSKSTAERGNSDSMHVTNAVPQMQPFNGGIWLELENYALQNARKDDMKISVFTGPFLTEDDPEMFGVQIPVEFWKVIAFIHDETGELCATGYVMSQEDFLSENEFVFGKHKTTQRSIASIEARAGLSFGPLAELDPFEEEEGIGGRELTDLSQIRFF